MRSRYGHVHTVDLRRELLFSGSILIAELGLVMIVWFTR